VLTDKTLSEVGICTKKPLLLLVCPPEVTVTFQLPPAPGEFSIVKVAVMVVEEETETFDTVMLVPACIVAP
jgi:hypothetical protein